jgi:hypothetical protein
MKKLIFLLFSLSFSFIFFDSARQAYAFSDPPFDFLFGNHIDTHQETRLNNKGELDGFFYIIFTGDTDGASGLPIARHPRGASQNEECDVDAIVCVAGWHISGKLGEAVFLFHNGVNGDDHPVWLVNRVNIPQPGSYTHFHWITNDEEAPTQTTDPRADIEGSIPDECNQQNGGQLETAGAADEICPGWFLEIRAVRSFAFDHGGEIIPVYAGDDNATHLNLVTNYQALEEMITETRGGGE